MENFVIDPTIAYDVVELPSRGIYYQSAKKSVRVAYLTASDENILSSQNLIKTNSVIEELLKRKVLDKDIVVEDLVEEDRQAILIFLRNTAFGSIFAVTTTDPKTNQRFNCDVDLSEMKFKEFTLTPNENQEYSFFMEKSKVGVTFKFLTRKQQKELEDIESSWNGNGVAPVITKELELMIKSVSGNREMMGIHNFVLNLPIKDSQDFRKFVKENKPSLDLSKIVTTPSGEKIQIEIGFGVDFFRPFYGL